MINLGFSLSKRRGHWTSPFCSWSVKLKSQHKWIRDSYQPLLILWLKVPCKCNCWLTMSGTPLFRKHNYYGWKVDLTWFCLGLAGDYYTLIIWANWTNLNWEVGFVLFLFWITHTHLLILGAGLTPPFILLILLNTRLAKVFLKHRKFISFFRFPILPPIVQHSWVSSVPQFDIHVRHSSERTKTNKELKLEFCVNFLLKFLKTGNTFCPFQS